jgi:hypothetical protein
MTTDDGSKNVNGTNAKKMRDIRKRFRNIESLSVLDRYVYLLFKQRLQLTNEEEEGELQALRKLTTFNWRLDHLGKYDNGDRRAINDEILKAETQRNHRLGIENSTGQPGTPPEERRRDS